jgi:hypothetical protein
MDEPVRPPRAAGWYRDPTGRYKYGYWDGSDWRPDVAAAMERMRTSWKPGIRRGAIVRIGEFLLKDETVERMATGNYYSWGNRGVFVVLTDRRLLFLIGGRRRAKVRAYPHESVSFVDSGWGGIAVFANGDRLRITEMDREDADEIAYATRRHTGQASKDSASWKRWLPPQWRR